MVLDGDDGPDLLGVIVGSEGTLGVAVEVTLRIVRAPEVVVTQLAAFTTVDAAGDAGPDPADRLAAVAGAYLRFAADTGAGFHVIYAAELRTLPDEERRAHTQALMATLLDLALVDDLRAALDPLTSAAPRS